MIICIFIYRLWIAELLINWNRLRADPRANESFEELCCQLAYFEDVPEDSTYVRLNPPDGGVECYWTLPDGSEWAWQAKYFHSIQDRQWTQIDKSVKRALSTHPNLKQYIICLPTNRSDARIAGRLSILDKWKNHVEDWKKIRDIEFVYWGSSEIERRLSREEQAGRRMYFFDEQILSQRWFRERCDKAIMEAGPRYTERPNVTLSISQEFEILGRTKKFHDEMKGLSREIQQQMRYVVACNSILENSTDLTHLKTNLDKIKNILRSTDQLAQKPVNFTQIQTACNEAREKIFNIVSNLIVKLDEVSDRSLLEYEQTRDFDDQKKHLFELGWQLLHLSDLIKNKEFHAANTGALLVRGEAGVGKTHLFCDVAKHRVENGMPTVLLHAAHLDVRDPENTILNKLGLGCKFDEFLGALEAAGQANGAKALILIDALNESENCNIWQSSLAGLINVISLHPWVGLAISVRTSYESITIPEKLLPNKLSIVEHRGFEYDLEGALKIFFDENGIERPSAPLLVPEFSNPQFLSLLCKGLKNRCQNRIPDELGGITSVYNFFLDSVNHKLSKNDLNYSENEQIVSRVVDSLIECMVEKNRTVLKYDEAVLQLQNDAYLDDSRSLLRYLISEGVLREELARTSLGFQEPVIMFAYERLADNLIVQGQLKKIKTEIELSALCKSGVFARYLASPTHHRGLIDALSIQLPERFKKELAEVYPEIFRSEIGRHSFLESLMWRNPGSIGEAASSLIAECLESKLDTDTVFRVLLTVSTNPKHPHNAVYLHSLLWNLEMGERDSLWSTFLHYNYSRPSPSIVRQYIEWASNPELSTLPEASAYLASLVLTWYLSSSNRSLRDRSTKALVSLWSRQIEIVVKVLQEFNGCNDPYVAERLYCAAYGYSMRTGEIKQLKKLAEYTYTVIFQDGSPPPNILLRDYARRIIEYALHKGINLKIKSNKLCPPYTSDWIEVFPSESDIDRLEKVHSTTQSKGALQIFNSLSGYGDFFRYVIGGNSDDFPWSCVPLLPDKTPRRQQLNRFCRNLNCDQLSSCKKYFLDSSKKEQFRQRLTEKQKRVFDRHISQLIEFLRNLDRKSLTSDLHAISRWIVANVFSLGWSKERFEAYDCDIMLNWGRADGRVERMGKKYQWIAYYELLARISDNFEFIDEDNPDALGIYEGAWQLSNLRNIDPSLVLSESKTIRNSPARWGDDFIYDAWAAPLDNVEWLKNTKDLPDFKSMIEINQKDGSTWLVLSGSITLMEPLPADQGPYELPRRRIFLLLESCLTRKTNTNKLFNWTMDLDPYRGKFPEPPSVHNTFLGELYWDESIFQPTYFDPCWIEPNSFPSRLPVRSLVSTYEYLSQTSEYDHSLNGETTWRLPHKLLVEKMNLIYNGDGTFVNVNGEVVAYDPSMSSLRESVLLVRKEEFVKFLLEKSYGIVWRLFGEKTASDSTMAFEGKWNGKLEIKGSYKTTNGVIRGSHCTQYITPQK